MIKEQFRKYLVEAIGEERSLIAFAAFEKPASVSVRINPFKTCPKPSDARPVEWSGHGFLLNERPVFTLDPHFHGGAYYVQDSSSMFVGEVFRRLISQAEVPESRPVRVLDLCAAPGGKSTDLAASLREMFGDRFILVTNEVMKQRVGILADNMALWGEPNVVVTSDDPSAFAALNGFFDVIVADVPCSGEGMFRKDEEAQNQWSEDNVALCAARQRRIVADVWPALRQGGIFIYSTCTFNTYENDSNVEWIADELGAEPLLSEDLIGGEGVIKTELGYSLVPGFVEGEGQYCSALKRTSENALSGGFRENRKKTRPSGPPVKMPEGIDKLFDIPMDLKLRGEMVIAVPKSLASEMAMLEQMHVIASGCAVGAVKGRDLVPDADLALSLALAQDAYPSVEVDRQTALSYLHRDAIILKDSPKGYILIRYEGLPLGFVKNLGNRCNSLHPQSRRIRMDIK
ncbi:MAG: rRNA cytosine-C5-methyltransferase [Bacteroidales bacterium]|nr:rRNA cytosine-C5-methyltransferase [Bacteroidales bacterium]